MLSQNIGEIGAGLYILQSDYELNLISNSELQKNIAHSSGGAIYIDNSQLNINNTKIYQNRAEVGGGIRFKNKTPNCLLTASRRQLNSFTQSLQIYDNTAKLFGNNYVSWIQEIKLIDEKKQIKNNTNIDNIRSGQSTQFQLQFLDDQQNEILWDNDLTDQFYSHSIINEIEQISISIIPSYLGTDKQNIYLTGETNLVLNKVQKTSNKYYINVTLYGQPTEKGNFDLIVPNLVNVNYQENQLIQNYEQKLKVGVNFRDCEIGELYWKMSQNFMECKICESGTYSFEQPKIDKIQEQSCKTCYFPGSNGCYRDQIYIKNGYWRETTQDLNFIKCNKIDKNNHCKAEESSSRDYCEEGYVGPLCKECDNYQEIWDTNFGRQIVTQKCIKCEQNYSFVNFLIYIAVIILEVWFIWFSIRNAINLGTNKTIGDYFRALKWLPVSNSSFFDITPFYCKQFFHYMAIQKYVQSISVSFTDTINIPITIFSSPIMVIKIKLKYNYHIQI
ncbi:hypothetical protein PPERSA_04082 [Pseudocohnilembus persalinus]|uniref:Pectin lyase fold/virulence factor n=1 Tax=Pseudocohnilembus persalinus TaxID=266149 RepID=A0A0V0QKR1_PSEPJ|nr:hypothetical protein PPERSA_04082 [Pseudocohnilembus persalinus]|eukprot:KRX02879.1 hypothetical protein PPERSA_04082 [Pseudocohnilembus persalinus]